MNQNQFRSGRLMPATRNPAHHQSGFTLVEIMVVIVILGLLATLVVPEVLGMGEEAKIKKAQSDVMAIFNQAKLYKLTNSRTPTLEELTTPDDKGKTYIENLTQDPWDHDYVIRDTEAGKFEVFSMGPDGSEGTEDDITSRPQKKQ